MSGADDATPSIDVWNLADDVPVYPFAKPIFNVVGAVAPGSQVRALHFSLNGGPLRRGFVKTPEVPGGRIERDGEFNIDGISREELGEENRLLLRATLNEGPTLEREVRFPCLQRPTGTGFRLDLDGVERPQQVGQIVDGHWRVARTSDGRPCLAIDPAAAGLDRVILFGHDRMAAGYRLHTRLRVTRWVGMPHNVGLVFHWNPHLQGDGTRLPGQWTTGLGYYFSNCAGLRVRIGVDVHVDPQGRKLGDHVLGEAVLAPWRAFVFRMARRFGLKPLIAQISPGRDQRFELLVREDRYALTVWSADRRRPEPQIVVNAPPPLLTHGAAGIIAHRCGVQVLEFAIEPA